MRLRQVVALVAPHVGRAAARMWAGEPALDLYRDWLGAQYDLIRATVPLLREALWHTDSEVLAGYFTDQLEAEAGHDHWVEDDWAAAGFAPDELTDRVPEPAVARLAGAQYYWIRHAHPLALLGHIAVLEWHPPRAELVPELMRRTGLPERAFGTLARHTELDTTHAAVLDDLLARLSLRTVHERLITTSAITTAHGLVELTTDIGGRHEPLLTPGTAGFRYPLHHGGTDRRDRLAQRRGDPVAGEDKEQAGRRGR